MPEFPVLHQAARSMASFPCCFPKRYCGPSSAVIIFDLRLVNTTTNALYLPVLLSKVFHFRPTLLPCLFVAFFAHFTSDLLEDVLISMCTIQAALYTFIAPYTNKSSCFFSTPATTRFV